MAILSTDSIPLQQAIRRRPTPKAVGGPATARAHGWSTDGSGAGTGPLGIYANFSSAPQFSDPDPDTGEVFQLVLRKAKSGFNELIPAPMTAEASRARRWARKRAADELLRGSRVWKCHRWSRPYEQISAMHSDELKRAFMAGLQVCANVHACPVCRAKIAERRRGEVQAAIEVAKARGWRVMLMTQTIPHGLGDDIEKLIGGITEAQSKFTSDRRPRAWRKAIGMVGFIRSFEITHGANGWHPHFHTIVFLKGDGPDIEQLQREGSEIWQQCAVAAGLPRPHPEHGFDIQDGSAAGAYITKWGIAEEVTKGASKAARGKGYTPEQLLDLYAQGDKQAGALFVAYTKALKGKSSLRWSKGLKAEMGVQQVDDQELAEQADDVAAEVVANISGPAWIYITQKGWQSVLLHFIEQDRPKAFEMLSEAEASAPRKTREGRELEGRKR